MERKINDKIMRKAIFCAAVMSAFCFMVSCGQQEVAPVQGSRTGFDCLAGAACLTDVLFFSGVDFLTFELLPDDWRVVLVAVRDSVFRA